MPTLLASGLAPQGAGNVPDASPVSTPPPAPKTLRIAPERLQSMFGDENAFFGAFQPATSEKMKARFADVPNRVQERQRIANTVFLADRFGLSAREVADRYDSLRQSYARQMFPDAPAIEDEGVFYSAVRDKIQGEKQEQELQGEMARRLFTSAVEGKDFQTAWQSMDLAEVASKGDKRRADVYNLWAMKVWEQNRTRAATLAPVINQATDYFADARAGRLGREGDVQRRDAAVDALARLSPEDRHAVLSLATERTASQPGQERGAVGKVLGTLTAATDDFFDSTAFGLFNTVESLVGHTDAEKARFDRAQVDRDFSRVLSGEVDPIKTDSFLGQAVLDFTREVPTMLAAATPQGAALAFFSLKERTRENLIAQGIAPSQAEGIASMQAIPQAAAYFVSSKMVFLGRVPKFAMPTKWTVGAFAGSVGKVAAFEYAGNIAINEGVALSDFAIRNMVANYNAEVPGVDWKTFGEQFRARAPQEFAMAIPAALIGTGVATFKNLAAGKRYLQQAELAETLGFTAEAKQAIHDAPDYPTTEKAFREGFETRDTTPPPAPATPQFKELPPETQVSVYRMAGKIATQYDIPGPTPGDRPAASGSAEQMREAGYLVPEGLPLPQERATVAEMRAEAEQSGSRAFQTIDEIRSMTPQQFGKAFSGAGEGFSNLAIRIGKSLASVDELRRAQEAFADAQTEAAAIPVTPETRVERSYAEYKSQFFREIYEVATNTGGAKLFMQFKEPGYKSPITLNPDGTYRVQAVKGAPAVTAATPEGAHVVAEAQKTEAAQQAATSPPEPHPEADGRALPPRITALNKETIAGLRVLFNMEELDAPTRERFTQVLDEAKRTNAPANADALATELLGSKRPATAHEHAAMVLRSAELQNLYESKAAEVADAWAAGDTARAEGLKQVADGYQAQLDTLTEASDRTGTEIGRALSIRRFRLNRDDYSLAPVVQRARIAQKGELTTEKLAFYQKLAEEHAAQATIIAEQKAKLLEQDLEMARQKAETFVAEGRTRRRSATAQDAAARRVGLKKELAALGYRMNDITSIIGQNVEAAGLVAKIADTYIDEGIASLTELTNKLKADIPDLSDQDIFMAVGRQIKTEAKKIQTEAQRRVKELRSQAALWAKINNTLNGVREDGATPMNKTQQNKLLRETLAQLRRQANRTVFDDAALKRIDGKIAEIQDHLAKSTRPVPKETSAGERKPNEQLTAAKKTLSELRQEMGALDTIAELESQLGEVDSASKPAAEGQPAKPAPTPAETNQRLNGLRERIAELRDQIDQAQIDPAAVNAERIARLQRLSAELEAQIEGGFRAIKEPTRTVADSDSVAAARKQVRELEQIMRTDDSISDLEDQLRTGEYKVSAPEQRILTNAALERAQIRQRQLRRQIDEAIETSRKRTVRENIVEGLLIPRTLLATADLSATLRQGLLLSASRPVTASRALVASIKAALNENTADAIALGLQRRPHWLEGERSGLFLSDVGGSMRAREEHFMSNFAERIPGIRRVVEASNRSMVTTLNLLRVSAFDGFLDAHPEATFDQKKAYANYVNAASGRGNVKWSASTVKTANALFFAPRYAVSRFQALYSPFKNFDDPIVRNAIVKDFGALLGTGLSLMGLAALAGAEVSFDSSDSDFGKIVVDDTRIDLWGGLQQPARLVLATVAQAFNRTGIAELENDVNPLESGLRFMGYKLSPALTVPNALLTGKNAIGQQQEWDETLLRSVIPLTLQETHDVMTNSEDPAKAAAAFFGGSVGIGFQEHTRR